MNDRPAETPLDPFDPETQLSPLGKAHVEHFTLRLAEGWAADPTIDGLAGNAIGTPEFMHGLTTLTMAHPRLAAQCAPTEAKEVQFLVQDLADYFGSDMPFPDYAVLRDAFLYMGLHHSLFAPTRQHDLLVPLRRAFWNHYMNNFDKIHDLIETGSPSAMAFFTICGILIPQDNKTSGLTVARFEKGKKQLKERLGKLDPITKDRTQVRNLLGLNEGEILQKVAFPVGTLIELASLAESLLICASQLKKESHVVSLRSCKTFRELACALKHIVDHPKDPISSDDYAHAVRALRLLTVDGIYISDSGGILLQDRTLPLD